MARKEQIKADETTFHRRIDQVFPVLAFVTLLVMSVHSVVAHDIWWQIRTGEWILTNGWPRNDPFSYGFPGQPWIEMRWLYCIVAWLGFQAGGLNFLILLKCAFVIMTGILLWRLSRGAPSWIPALAIGVFIAVGHDRFTIRPELVTFMMLAAFFVLLEKHRSGGGRKWLYVLLALQVIWANSHTLFILGPVLLATVATGYYAGRMIKGWRFVTEGTALHAQEVALCAGGAIVASLLTPYFIDGLAFPFRLFGQIREGNVLDEIISEFVSPWQRPALDFLFVSYLATIIGSAATFLLQPRKMSLSRLFVWGSYFFLSCLAWRNVALFALVSAAVMILNLRDAFHSGTLRSRAFRLPVRLIGVVLFIGMIVLTVTNVIYRSTERERHFGFGITPQMFPVASLAFIENHNLPRPVLTSLGDAGYAIFEGGEKSVFVDGRLEVYTPAQIAEAVRILTTGEGFLATMAQHQIRTAVLRINDQLPVIAMLLQRQDWVPVFYDMRHVVFLQTMDDTSKALAETLRVRWDNPELPQAPEGPGGASPRSWLRDDSVVRDHNAHLRLARLLVTAGQPARAKAELLKAVEIRASDDVLLYLGSILEAEGDPQGQRYLSRLDPATLRRTDVRRVRAEIAAQSGRIDLAAELMKPVITSPEARQDDFLRLASYVQRTDLPSAIEVMRLSVARYPDDPQNWNNLARLLILGNVLPEARAALERSLSLNPVQAEAHHLLGLSYLQEGNRAAGVQALREALARDPGYAPTRQVLEQLREMQ